MNQMWAAALGLNLIEPLVDPASDESNTQRSNVSGRSVGDGILVEGSGRLGRFPAPITLGELARAAIEIVGGSIVRAVGATEMPVTKVAIACGSGGSFLAATKRRGCQALVTGEATFHTSLEARSMGIGMVLVGHYQSERFAMERLADLIADEFPGLSVWASREECDPIASLSDGSPASF